MCRSTHRSPGPAARRAAVPPDDQRVGDADRDVVVARLREHAAVGRLDLDELEARVERAHRAVLGADLRAVDLREDPRVAAERRRREVREHAAQYLAVMALLVLIWALTGAGAFWPVWPMLGWGIGVAAHAASVHGARQPRRPVAHGG
jgi:hypothetical protein